jgi:hypothetical protein
MEARCKKNPEHKNFIVTVRVFQKWRISQKLQRLGIVETYDGYEETKTDLGDSSLYECLCGGQVELV